MTTSIVHPAVERHLIHAVSCRHRAQRLCCGTCSELADRAARVMTALRLAEAA